MFLSQTVIRGLHRPHHPSGPGRKQFATELDRVARNLAPAFNANELIYAVNVGSSIENVVVKATLQVANSTMTVNGQNTDSDQERNIILNPAGQSTPHHDYRDGSKWKSKTLPGYREPWEIR
ncbi:MAG: cadherin-like beta sandwich domain-containing protein [Nitrospira sp.]|nr:cadherin-like beta sandwich domain-containing protein [Nitrospira sp.]